MRRIIGALLLLGGLWMAAPPAHGQYCGSGGGNTPLLAGYYTSGLYPTYPSTYGGFYGYPYYGGVYPYPAYGGYYPYSASFLNGYSFFGAGGYYPFLVYGAFYPFFGDPYYNYPIVDYGYRGRPAYMGLYYGGYPFYGGTGGGPLQAYTPYALAGGNYGSAPSLYLGLPSYAGGYAPYSSALYLPTFFTGGQPFSILYC
ncbi:MAG TPA: hypothetical protein VFB73_07835 [Chloroflexota bacterium]|nr:hypothetical protein [Chloroflexota bacterium]